MKVSARWVLASLAGLAIGAAASTSQAAVSAQLWGWFQSDSEAGRQYQAGREALDRGNWTAAIRAFERVGDDASRADGAFYWKAYAQNKLGEPNEALQTLELLEESFPQSQWLDDARALRQEMSGGRSPRRGAETDADEDLKLMALNSLMHADENEAVPLLEEFLTGRHSTKLKARALFVLAQSGSERARQVVAGVARDDSDEELQSKAIQYLGIHGGRESQALLKELYGTLQSSQAKRAVLHSFMVADQQASLVEVARNESDPELRGQAVHWLGTMSAEDELWTLYGNESSLEVKKKILHALFIGDSGARLLEVARDRSEAEELRLAAIHWLGVSDHHEELWTLYQSESSLDVKKRILHGLFVSGNTERLAAVARNRSEPGELRQAAIHHLGTSGSETRPILKEIYASDTDPEIRKRILHSLFIQDAVTELVELARAESDSDLKKQAVHWLSLMDSQEAKQFMLEILRK